MGLGDDIMATADARHLKRKHPSDFIFIGTEKRPEWSEVFENNPNINHPNFVRKAVMANKAHFVPNYIGHRPYIRRAQDPRYVEFNQDYSPEPGDIYLTEKERQWATDTLGKGYILLEPHIKPGTFGGNKAWIWDRWQEVAETLISMGMDVRQNSALGKRLLRGVKETPASGVRKMLAAVSNAGVVVTTDGALHHAAAALNVPAVVIWGSRVKPSILGYKTHQNLYTGDGEDCGALFPCKKCEEGMKRITVEMVVDAASRSLRH